MTIRHVWPFYPPPLRGGRRRIPITSSNLCLQLYETGSLHYSVTIPPAMVAVCLPINSVTTVSPNNSATKASYCVSAVTPQLS